MTVTGITVIGVTVPMPMVWIFIAFIFGVVEAMTTSLTSIWFVAGGVAAAIAAFFTDNIITEIVVFLAVSAILLLTTRPILVKKMKVGKEHTNVDAMIGRTVVVTKDISPVAPGEAKVGGLTWAAAADHTIAAGTEVVIKRVEGVKIIVEEK